MARWKATGHAVIVAFTCYFNCLPQAALAASEAQLKFVPALAASSTSKEDRFRSPREFNGFLVNKSRPLNATIDVAMRKQIIGPVEHYAGKNFHSSPAEFVATGCVQNDTDIYIYI